MSVLEPKTEKQQPHISCESLLKPTDVTHEPIHEVRKRHREEDEVDGRTARKKRSWGSLASRLLLGGIRKRKCESNSDESCSKKGRTSFEPTSALTSKRKNPFEKSEEPASKSQKLDDAQFNKWNFWKLPLPKLNDDMSF
eukprot:TRINITY_DN10703_c0_g1_i1.p1 TRINITY_DN10703_c0_g1~~TRINITY_DN10703_c0_g1_i1.p1  ORF type:complete len:140 (+),score=20.29 TRINITY_DN10703_c0_g1_i1:61-480(+)